MKGIFLYSIQHKKLLSSLSVLNRRLCISNIYIHTYIFLFLFKSLYLPQITYGEHTSFRVIFLDCGGGGIPTESAHFESLDTQQEPAPKDQIYVKL